MEAVGLTAAAISITKTAKAASQLVNKLYHVAKEAELVANQMKRAAMSLRSFSTNVTAAQASMTRHCPRGTCSPAIEYIREYNLGGQLRDESRYLRMQIQELEERMSKISSTVGSSKIGNLITSWRWTQLKPTVDGLMNPMESLKASLILALNVVTLEVVSAQGGGQRSQQLEREM